MGDCVTPGGFSLLEETIMVIDMHTFPGFFEEICEDPKKIEFRRE